jgi:hypothetical protein
VLTGSVTVDVRLEQRRRRRNELPDLLAARLEWVSTLPTSFMAFIDEESHVLVIGEKEKPLVILTKKLNPEPTAQRVQKDGH